MKKILLIAIPLTFFVSKEALTSQYTGPKQAVVRGIVLDFLSPIDVPSSPECQWILQEGTEKVAKVEMSEIVSYDYIRGRFAFTDFVPTDLYVAVTPANKVEKGARVELALTIGPLYEGKLDISGTRIQATLVTLSKKKAKSRVKKPKAN